MIRPLRCDQARPLRYMPALEALERRDLLSWSPQLVALAEVEPNNVITQAQDLGSIDFAQGVRVAGGIGSPTDVDFYRFEVDTATDVTVRLAGTGIASLYDDDPLATPLGYSQLLQLDAGSSQSLNLLPGTYEIAVSGVGDRYFSPILASSGTAGTTGPYTLTVAGDNPTYDTSAPLAVVRTDIPAAGFTSSPLAINVTLTAPLNLQQDYVTILDANQNDTEPNVAWHPAVNDLVITPVAPLGVGKYEVVAYDNDGNLLFSLPFAVVGRSGLNNTLATATPLADLTHAGLVQVAGAIGTDPYYSLANPNPGGSAPANQVDLYSFTISGTERELLTAEVFAGRIGSSLDAALTLFRITGANANGSPNWQVVASANASDNQAVAVNGSMPLLSDPSLFAGLDPGTYCIAVTASGNEDTAGGSVQFNPNDPHSAQNGSSTGAYVLNLFVQPASTTPAQVQSTSISANQVVTGPPTQLTVQFSAPVNLAELSAQSAGPQQVTLVSNQVGPLVYRGFPVFIQDAAGDDYPLALSSYDLTTGLATFTLPERLTDGSYTLHLSGPDGLTDLAGDPLQGNDPSGDFVVPFTVADSVPFPLNQTLAAVSDSFAAPTNLGVLFPAELAAGLNLERHFQDTRTAPSGSVDYFEFTLVQDSTLVVSLGGPGLNVAGRPVLLNAQGAPLYPAIDPEQPNVQSVHLLLQAGTYFLAVGGWNPSASASAVYTLSILQTGSQENPTPLTTGPAPAYLLRLDTAAPTSAAPSPSSSAGTVPQLTLPSSGTPNVTLTVDRGAASSVLPGATPLVGSATNLASGPVGVVGSAATASGEIRLVLPGTDAAVNTVAAADDLQLLILSPAPPVGLARVNVPPPEPPVSTSAQPDNLLACGVDLGRQALLAYVLEEIRLSPLLCRPLYLGPDQALVEERNEPTEPEDAPETPLAVASVAGAFEHLGPLLWITGVAALACVGSEVQAVWRRKPELSKPSQP